MVRHVVMWSFQQGYNQEQQQQFMAEFKTRVEALQSIDGVISIQLVTTPASTSNRDMMLDSFFESEEALAAYQVHPVHVQLGQFVATMTEQRACFDYITK